MIRETWMKQYYYAKKYYEEHGNLLIPQDYIVVEENKNLVHLGHWINNQRKAYKNKGRRINPKQIELLNEIGMVWNIRGNEDIISTNWLKNYEYAKKYHEEHGELLIPWDYTVIDENGSNINLGPWINTQRIAYKNKRLKEKQIELLNGIDMIWGVKYYKEKLALIERRFLQYQYGLLDEQNVNELIKEGVFEYKDSELTKGNAAVLTRNIPTKNVG